MLRALLFALASILSVVFCGSANQLPTPPRPADPGFNRLRGYKTVIPSPSPTPALPSYDSETGNGSGGEGGGSELNQAARADKAEIAGILKTISLDEDGNESDQSFMIVVNEYAGREIVRQSVGYHTLRKIIHGKLVYYTTRFFDISDYGAIKGKLSFEEFHTLLEYLDDVFKKADNIRQTMSAVYKYPYISRLILTFESTAWTSLPIELHDEDWDCREVEGKHGERECLWTPGPTVSNSIRPYHFTEAREIVRGDSFYEIYSNETERQTKL